MRLLLLFLLTLLPTLATLATAQQSATGTVYHDLNNNQSRDDGEPGLPGVLVSNQIEITKTDAEGRWSLPASDDCIFFLIKPRGWTSPVDAQQLPRFFYTHKPAGSPKSQFPGVAPTGPLPASIDFPLTKQEEPDQFKAIFFGDTQARDLKELDYMAQDTIPELIGTDAKFGVTLGDILFNDLSLYDTHNSIIALIGRPWFNVIGNHDLNFDAPSDKLSDETFERVYGPAYYAFTHGPVHFVALDNVRWGGDRGSGGSGTYTGELGEDQLQFLTNLLPHIPQDELLVLMMHIPLHAADGPGESTADREQLFRLIESRPYTMSISGHTHWQAHQFLDQKSGWKGKAPHHHVVNVTVCGSWWTGEPDELGIPHSTMRDGAPRGYSFINFDGQQAIVDFKAARRPADYQLRIEAPDSLPASKTDTTIHVNVFGGSEKSTVRMRVGDTGEWIPLEKTLAPDPDYLAMKQREEQRADQLEGRPLSNPVPSRHLWKA
ncbi:MAG: calcineurin-like phosphoesterase family protein, partial [Verrucomicrobia bacterium]|nr:calcineurin-like phosphoesterase family protein [Verrucomicrobiota bacterium]